MWLTPEYYLALHFIRVKEAHKPFWLSLTFHICPHGDKKNQRRLCLREGGIPNFNGSLNRHLTEGYRQRGWASELSAWVCHLLAVWPWASYLLL